MLVCFCRFQRLGLRKHPRVSLVLRYNVAGWLPLGLVNRACQFLFASADLQVGVVDDLPPYLI